MYMYSYLNILCICTNNIFRNNENHIPKLIYNTPNDEIICFDCSKESNIESNINKVLNKMMLQTLKIKCKNNSNNNKLGEGILVTNGNHNWIGKIDEYVNHIKTCNFENITCEYCNTYKTIRKLMNKHYDVCDDYIINCDLNCGQKIERKDK